MRILSMDNYVQIDMLMHFTVSDFRISFKTWSYPLINTETLLVGKINIWIANCELAAAVIFDE